MHQVGFAGFFCRLEFSSFNGLHTLLTIGTINPQTPYAVRYNMKMNPSSCKIIGILHPVTLGNRSRMVTKFY